MVLFASVLRLSDESVLALAGAKLLTSKDPDVPFLEADMRAAYVRMRADEDAGRLHGTIDPMWVGEKGSVGIVFLHGLGGRFALPCWQLAHAIPGAVVACPSIGTDGDWWNHAAEVRAAMASLGTKKTFVVGLSNGGIGATRLAAGINADGFVAISGVDPASACPKGPVLVVQGKRDSISAAAGAKAWAAKCGGTYVELDAGHFALLRKPDEAEAALRNWITAR